MKLREMTFEPVTCEKCGKWKRLYWQVAYRRLPETEKRMRHEANLVGDKCKECIYQDINRIYEVRERVMAIRIDYSFAPERVRL